MAVTGLITTSESKSKGREWKRRGAMMMMIRDGKLGQGGSGGWDFYNFNQLHFNADGIQESSGGK